MGAPDGPERAGRSPAAFFALVFLLTTPFVVIEAVRGGELMPGIPLTGLAFVCPVVAAVLLTHRESGRAGVVALLKRSYDARRIRNRIWLLPVLLLYPAVLVLSFFVLRLRGVEVPAPDIAVGPALALAAVFLVTALAEELGWSGYLLDPLQQRWGALVAGLVVGAGWAVWHWVALLQVGRSLDWIGWWTVATVAMRVIMVWLYANTGRSVLATALFHLTGNLGWQLFPVAGSHFDPPSTAMLLVVIAIAVTLGWGPRTLARSSSSGVRPADDPP